MCETYMTTYTDKNGDFRFRKACEVIVDITDGYLSNDCLSG